MTFKPERIVPLMFAAVISLVVLISVVAMAIYAPDHKIDDRILEYTYRLLDIMLGAIVGGGIVKHQNGKKEPKPNGEPNA